MKIDEAIYCLKDESECTKCSMFGKNHGDNCYNEACNIAIKALEKQIPKKPDIEGDGYSDGHLVYDTWICPNCGKYYEIDYDNYDYCPNCGQHIDRSQLN